MPVKGLDECETPTRNDIKAALHEAGGWPDDIKTTVNNPYTWPLASCNFIAPIRP